MKCWLFNYSKAEFIIFCLILCGTQSFAQDDTTPSSGELKKLSIEELMDIEIVSVSKHKEKLTEAASAIQVITNEDIRRSGATNVPEALRLASNLQVAQVNSSQWAISARGFNNVLSNKLLVLIDGRVVYTPMYAGVFWDVQNLLLDDVERIEVISGPGGTLWGANAVNGVINIILKKSQDTTGFLAEAAVGTELRGLGNLRYGGKLADNLYYRVYGTAFKKDKTIYQDSVDANDTWQMAQGGVRLDWEANENDLVTFQTNLYDGRPDPDGGSPVIARGSNAMGRWNRTISETSSLQVQAYFDQTWRDFNNGFSEKLRTYDIEAQHRFRLSPSQEIIYGGGFRFLDHQVTNIETAVSLFAFLPARKSIYLFNAFVQDEIALIQDRLQFTIGMKVEHHTYAGFQYQPNARLTWTPTNSQTIWMGASRAVRTPARIDREFFLTFGIPFIAGSDFKSEEVIAYELGWRVQPQERLSISLATFYNVYDNLRTVEPGPPPFGLPSTFGNGLKGNTYGAELSSTYQATDWWRVKAGYTYVKKELTLKPNSADGNEGSAESNDPQQQVVVQSYMDLPSNIKFTTIFRYIDKLPDPYVSDYIGLDVQLGIKVTKFLELSVVGQNLVKSSHTEFIPDSPYPKGIQRGVYGKIICRF